MNKTKIKVIAGVLVVFLLGVVIGVLGTGIFIRHGIRKFTQREPGTHRTFFMRRLSRELKLTQAQKPDVEKIVAEADVEIHEFIQQSRFEFTEIMQRRNAQLKEILSPEQQKKLDEMLERIQKRWNPQPPPGAPPPPKDHR